MKTGVIQGLTTINKNELKKKGTLSTTECAQDCAQDDATSGGLQLK